MSLNISGQNLFSFFSKHFAYVSIIMYLIPTPVMVRMEEDVSCSVVSDSLQTHEL